jgi:hypothetical protein
MTTALNALEGQLKLDPKIALLQTMETRRATTWASRRKTRKTCSVNVNKRRMMHGRKSHQRTVKRRRSK